MKKGGGGSSNENNNNENNNNETNSLRKKFELNKSSIETYLTVTLNDHQNQRIIFFLGNCLDKRIFKNTEYTLALATFATHKQNLEQEIIYISNELSSNPKRREIIETIRQYIENTLISYANYMKSLYKNQSK